jgi:hypothetical protein
LRLVRIVLGIAATGIGGLLALAFYERYWRWRDCFNELGRCFDPATQDVYLEQSGEVYGGLAVLFLILGLALLARRRRVY